MKRTCKDCLHFEACKYMYEAAFDQQWFPFVTCDRFKDRSRIIELPCKPGTTVYMLHNNTDACLDCPHHVVYFNDEDCTHPDYKVYFPTIQDSPVCDKQFWEVIDHTATELFLFNHRESFGKTVFLTREEAEAELARRTANG